MSKSKLHFLDKKLYALTFSLLLTLASLALIAFKGLNLGLDFKGGALLEMDLKKKGQEKLLKETIEGELEITNKNDSLYVIKLEKERAEEGRLELIVERVKKAWPEAELLRLEYLGPKTGASFALDSVKALVFSLIIMTLYIWFRFDLKYGLGILIALFHDLVITLGFFSITGYSFDFTSVAVLLTILGYSINDSIVIYDRIRENLKKKLSLPFEALINFSINETLSRTIMTSFTTLLVCISLLIFGGESLRGFSAALSFGIAFGTYSSIYISAPILIFFNGQKKS